MGKGIQYRLIRVPSYSASLLPILFTADTAIVYSSFLISWLELLMSVVIVICLASVQLSHDSILQLLFSLPDVFSAALALALALAIMASCNLMRCLSGRSQHTCFALPVSHQIRRSLLRWLVGRQAGWTVVMVVGKL